MPKTTKIIAALGVVAGLGVAALPLSSYATDPTATSTVNVTIDPTLSISASTPIAIKVTNANTTAATGTGTTTVITNNQYGYKLTAQGASLSNAGVSSSSFVATGAVATTSSYGLTAGDLTNYASISSAATVKTTSESTSATGDGTSFTVGVFAAGNQEAGTYTGDITWTASANAS